MEEACKPGKDIKILSSENLIKGKSRAKYARDSFWRQLAGILPILKLGKSGVKKIRETHLHGRAIGKIDGHFDPLLN